MIINKKTKGFQTFNDIETENAVYNSNALELYQVKDFSALYEKIIKNNYKGLEFIEDENGKLIDVNIVGFPALTPKENREQIYTSEPIVQWEGELITVDQANKKYYNYFAEGSPKATKLQELIINAKEEIRNRYPDAQ